MNDDSTPDSGNRLAAALLVAIMGIGSLTLWIGVPIGSAWAASKFTESSAEHFMLALLMALVGMSVFALILVWLNDVFLRTTGAERRARRRETRLGGPLERMLAWSFAIALVALFVWFFFLAQNPSQQVI